MRTKHTYICVPVNCLSHWRASDQFDAKDFDQQARRKARRNGELLQDIALILRNTLNIQNSLRITIKNCKQEISCIVQIYAITY